MSLLVLDLVELSGVGWSLCRGQEALIASTCEHWGMLWARGLSPQELIGLDAERILGLASQCRVQDTLTSSQTYNCELVHNHSHKDSTKLHDQPWCMKRRKVPLLQRNKQKSVRHKLSLPNKTQTLSLSSLDHLLFSFLR